MQKSHIITLSAKEFWGQIYIKDIMTHNYFLLEAVVELQLSMASVSMSSCVNDEKCDEIITNTHLLDVKYTFD